MTEKETEEQYVTKRSRSQLHKKNKKFDKLLNYLIAIVIGLIAITLFVIFSTEPEPEKEKLAENNVEDNVNEQATNQELEQQEIILDDEETFHEEETTEDFADQSSSLAGEAVDVEQVNDGIVIERWTSDNWEPFPTKQEGPHASVYQKGHIDYEEKLSAIFSVIPLEQSNSIVLRVQNDGSPQTSRAVVTNMDKTEIYRVFIKWIDSEGWQPTMVEVLASLDNI